MIAHEESLLAIEYLHRTFLAAAHLYYSFGFRTNGSWDPSLHCYWAFNNEEYIWLGCSRRLDLLPICVSIEDELFCGLLACYTCDLFAIPTEESYKQYPFLECGAFTSFSLWMSLKTIILRQPKWEFALRGFCGHLRMIIRTNSVLLSLSRYVLLVTSLSHRMVFSEVGECTKYRFIESSVAEIRTGGDCKDSFIGTKIDWHVNTK